MIDKPLENLTKVKREKTQNSKTRNEKGRLTTSTKRYPRNHQELL
jgi:hypothetical protein